MKKIIISNICTALLVAFIFQPGRTSHSSPEHLVDEDSPRDRVIQKYKEKQSRSTASIKCAAKELLANRPDLDKYSFDQNNWEEQLQKVYAHPIKHHGQKINLAKELKPFYLTIYHNLKNLYGENSAKYKMANYFKLKEKYNEDMIIFDNRSHKESEYVELRVREEVTKYRSKLIKSGDYTAAQVDELVDEFAMTTEELHTNNYHGKVMLEKTNREKEYRVGLIKLFGEDGINMIERMLKDKNEELHATYGNYTYTRMRYYMDESTNQMVQEDGVEEEVEMNTPKVKIKL